MDNFLLTIVALFLVALNGFFVAAEFGLVKLRQTRVHSIAKTGWRGQILVKVHSQLDAYLSACQLGITLASLGLGWIGEPAFVGLLEPIFALIGIESAALLHSVSFIVAFTLISFLHIVVGELAPKSMAIRRPEVIALWTATPLYFFYWIMYPAIWLLNRSANLVLRVAGLDGHGGHDSHYSYDELKLILRANQDSEEMHPQEWNVVAQSLDFSKLKVSDLMRPFHEAAALHTDRTLDENLQTIAEQRFSRYPYVDEEGRVLGVIHLKNLFLAELRDAELGDLSAFVRPVEEVSPDTPVMELFRRFRAGAPHFAVAAYGDEPPVGFLTLDNLLGALVGEIRDEFRQSRNDWMRQDDGSLLGKGSLPLFSLGRALGMDIDHPEAETVGGLVQWKLGNLPAEGERIEFEGFDVVVKKMNGPRIVMVKIIPHTEADDVLEDDG
ncbi:HlyC/CorC family transporter [Chitinibacter bivalviorum]|uniref:HlyC/CorC family transporter n=1 Tax=Chitinibacter bivalviorum TaxID=2739434 RepID=A0A7H9BFW9_9NEIS|nr:hemolysin family protein [Chitinibacter bivalviorum]QLG87487.1 HlyC/CorC family transporter [Chitinibacter bivalviorum]